MKFLFNNGTVTHLLSIKDSILCYLQLRNLVFLTHGAHRLRIIFRDLLEQLYDCRFHGKKKTFGNGVSFLFIKHWAR